MQSLSLIYALALVACPVAAVAQDGGDRGDAARAVVDLARAARIPRSTPPALAVVVTRPGSEPVIYVDGIADVRTGAKAGPDTPFYIASMTKAYVGLMAASLDQSGVFDLDQTMADVWPGITVPGLDFAQITFRNLLAHQAPIENDELTGATAYVREVPASEYGSFLGRSTARDPGFQYDNLGYILYGAALELKTGRHWRDWLTETVLEPIGLEHTGPRVSGWTDAAAGHEWIGDGLWQTRSVKADELMHAAGGLMTSPKDMARWLAANAERTRLPASAFAEAQTLLVAAEADQDGIACHGYSLGWRTCLIADEPILLHGGGYTGARSGMAIAPRLGIGVAVLSNSDGLTGYLSGALIKSFLSMAADPNYEPQTPEVFGEGFEKLLETQLQRRINRLQNATAEPVWEGWAWTPDPTALDAYVGRYGSELGDVEVDRDGGTLVLTLGELRRKLRPAAPDLFGAASSPIAPPEQARFIREDGNVVSLDWAGDLLPRIN